MVVWTCLETQKKKKTKKEKKRKKKKEIGNVTMKYLSLSWQASIGLAYLPTSSFILSFFLLFSLFPLFFLLFSLFSLFPLFFLSFFCFLYFGASIYSLTQWHEILYIVDVIEGFDMKLAFIKNWKHNLEASLSVFWSQNWILLDVSIDSYMVLMWFNWSITTINATLQLLDIYIE